MNNVVGIITNIRRVVMAYDEMLKPVCKRYGLTVIEAKIISFLHNNPEYDTAASISEYRLLSKSNISTAVDNLLKRNLLLKKEDDFDRRKIHLLLTSECLDIIKDIEIIKNRFNIILFNNFSQQEKELFLAFHKRIADNINKEEYKNE